MVGIETDHIHTVITRVTGNEEGVGEAALKVRRVRPKEIFCPQIVLRQVPEGFELFGCTMTVTPPEPETIVLMPGTEDEGDSVAVIVSKGVQKHAYAFKPCHEAIMYLTLGKDSSDDPGLCIPRRTTGDGVTRMPTDGDDSTTAVVGTDLFTDAVKGYAVEVFGVPHLDAT